MTTSLRRIASDKSRTGSILHLIDNCAAKFLATSPFRSNAKILSSGNTAHKARSCAAACRPHPQIVATRLFVRARYFVANAVAAAVRLIVISMESRMARTAPLFAGEDRDNALDSG